MHYGIIPWLCFGRKRRILRNDVLCIFKYTLVESLFRIPHVIFMNIVHTIGPRIQKSDTPYRQALRDEFKVPAFLMWCGGERYEQVAGRLCIGCNTTTQIIREVSRKLSVSFMRYLKLPNVLQGFERIFQGSPIVWGYR